jgi:hypothetical protein
MAKPLIHAPYAFTPSQSANGPVAHLKITGESFGEAQFAQIHCLVNDK